jgi:DNA-binding PadR family transcriptional regulator
MKNELYTQFDSVFFEKTRLSMMTMLYQEKTVSFNRFKNIIDGTDGAIYSHLQKLQEAEYITQKKKLVADKAQTFYSLTAKGTKLFQDYLKFLENIILQK